MVANVKSARVSIFAHSATSVIKWMGREGFTTAEAKAAVAALASGSVSESTIATGLSDGKNPKYNANAAELSRDEQAKLKTAAGRKAARVRKSRTKSKSKSEAAAA